MLAAGIQACIDRIAEHPHSVANQCGEPFDARQQFGLLVARRVGHLDGDGREILAHQLHGALEVFAHLRVWDTEHNNGVLIYVQVADRDVEIVADRGFEGRVSPAEWEAVCRLMEEHFRAGRFQEGWIAGVDAIANLLARHFPQAAGLSAPGRNQLPDRPTLL